MKKISTFALAAALSMGSLFLSACGGNDKTELHVLPTNFGMNYLKDENAAESKKEDIENAYHMVVDASAVQNSAFAFNYTGTDYTDDDIDVKLFGIGTNSNNSRSAHTFFYATLDADAAKKNRISFAEDEKIVTKVEYVKGTGPIQKSIR